MSLPPKWTVCGAAKESGQSFVYRVKRAGWNGTYALKRLKNNARRGRFSREVRAMRELADRGLTVIPKVVDSDLSDPKPWFAMPWYEDGSFEEHVTAQTFRRKPSAGVRSLAQIARAIQDLHAAGVAHRDLKPANILIDGSSIILADLGLCFGDHDEDRQTQTNERIGSYRYIAPENESGVNPAADQKPADFYAFGKILWALLAGKQPPARESQLEHPLRLETELGDARMTVLAQLQQRLLAIDATTRLADWREVVETLDHFAAFLDGLAPSPRDHFAVAASSDGLIYVVGGQALTGGAVDTCETFDPRTEVWTRQSSLPTARLSLGAAAVGDRIYAIGGEGFGRLTGDVESFSPEEGCWHRHAPLPTSRSDSVVVAVPDGRIFVLGGLAPGLSAAVEAYQPSTEAWSVLAPMPTARRGAAGAVGSDGRLYLMGGVVGSEANPTGSSLVYDPFADCWSSIAPMPTARAWLAGVLGANGLIYAVGGFNTRPLAVVEVYDPVTDAWMSYAALQTPRANPSAVKASNDKIYVIGGERQPHPYVEVLA